MARHLVLFALFYSELGQTLIAEGLYRKSIELLKNVYTLTQSDNIIGNQYNYVFALNMYGRLLLRQDKRVKEGEGIF